MKFHYFSLLKIPESSFRRQIEEIAKALQQSNVEIVLLPDRGVSFEVAKKYKEFGGKHVYGTVPLSDTDFGIKHLQPYLDAQVNGKHVFDKVIDTQNWYKQDLTHCIFGDVVLMLGNSLGALGELVYGFYLYKLFVGEKPEVQAKKNAIHPEVRAGQAIPFSVIAYAPFLKGTLNYEIEAYIRKVKGELYYVKSPAEIKQLLEKISPGACP
ncbi:hypothetical protein D6783_01060 [Candidatus Woesearchaeota archaeon]|nr:MAG: hypothetical protein D6783_01060 [Candidatus Woesearchaeota archaeon]